jgi:GNAT superfamily N-acetyltransferase
MNNENEKLPEVGIREIGAPSKEVMKAAASLVAEYSWGNDYPVSPLAEIQAADFCVGAYYGDALVGFASVGRIFSPDGKDNGELWLAHAVVAPPFREQGIFQALYEKQLAYAQSSSGRILACTSNPIMEKFFLGHGWSELRKTSDETGEPCIIFEYQGR